MDIERENVEAFLSALGQGKRTASESVSLAREEEEKKRRKKRKETDNGASKGEEDGGDLVGGDAEEEEIDAEWFIDNEELVVEEGGEKLFTMEDLFDEVSKSIEEYVKRKRDAAMGKEETLVDKIDEGEERMRRFVRVCCSNEKFKLSPMQETILNASMKSDMSHFFGRADWRNIKPILMSKYRMKDTREVTLVQAPRQVGKTLIECLIAIALAMCAAPDLTDPFVIDVLALNQDGSIMFVNRCKEIVKMLEVPEVKDFKVIPMAKSMRFTSVHNNDDRRIIKALSTGKVRIIRHSTLALHEKWENVCVYVCVCVFRIERGLEWTIRKSEMMTDVVVVVAAEVVKRHSFFFLMNYIQTNKKRAHGYGWNQW